MATNRVRTRRSVIGGAGAAAMAGLAARSVVGGEQAGASPAGSGLEPFIGEIAIVPYNFAPRGWALCNGQILSISQNTALFSLLGTTFGGDGRTTFALPDLRGRVPLHSGQGPGLGNRVLGESAGVEEVQLTEVEMPAHDHTLMASDNKANDRHPAGHVLARRHRNFADSANLVAMHDDAVTPAGGGSPHENMQPYLALNFIIALEGIFPSRN